MRALNRLPTAPPRRQDILLDINDECLVNLEDAAAFVSCMNGPNAAADCPPADVDSPMPGDPDGDVGLADFAAFQRSFPTVP